MYKKTVILLLSITFVALFVWAHNVPKYINDEDKAYLSLIFEQNQIDADSLSFEEQIVWIDAAIFKLHKELAVLQPIDYKQNREPKDLYENGGGFCYDFSRTIEKHLLNNGFETRHVAVYLRSGNYWSTISSPGVFSHSLTEVKTKKGWMIIDSNIPFYAQDQLGNIYSFEDLKESKEAVSWKIEIQSDLKPFYSNNIEYVYGLYSRHGKFYKPYNFIPDFNLKELFYNF